MTVTFEKEFPKLVASVAVLAIVAVVGLFFAGMNVLQETILVGSLCLLPVTFVGEKVSKKKRLSPKYRNYDDSFSELRQFWKKTKSTVQRKMRKDFDDAESDSGQSDRQDEQIKMPGSIGDSGTRRFEDSQSLPKKDHEAKRKSRPRENSIRSEKHLDNLISEVKEILSQESNSSLGLRMKPILNELAASNRMLRRSSKLYRRKAADYWAAWAIVKSISDGVPIDPTLGKYVTRRFRSSFDSFTRFAITATSRQSKKSDTRVKSSVNKH